MKGQSDMASLQQDMDNLVEWEKLGMKFHPDKCEIITIIRKCKHHQASYTLRGHLLKDVNQAKYLGINRVPEEVWITAYKTMVHPQVEYCGAIWDPNSAEFTHNVKMVQWWAARYVLGRYYYL